MNRKGSHRDDARNGQLRRELGRQKYERLRDDSRTSVRYYDQRRGTSHSGALKAHHRVALRFSTLGREADDISRALRESPREALERHAGVIAAYNDALDRLPPHPGTVYRGLCFESQRQLDRFLDGHWQGDTVVYHGFTHASVKRDVAEGAAGKGVAGGVLVRIESRQGRHLAPWSAYPDEEEVAFKLGVKFQVDGVKQEDGTHIITLIDIEEE